PWTAPLIVVRFDATTLWHFDAAEWAPSTASKADKRAHAAGRGCPLCPQSGQTARAPECPLCAKTGLTHRSNQSGLQVIRLPRQRERAASAALRDRAPWRS